MLFLPLLPILSLAAATPHGRHHAENETNPVIDLDQAGSYRGVLQNDGLVQAWYGIPYAEPPLGDLRFMPPRPLRAQSSSSDIINATSKPNRCLQFTLAPYGVRNPYLGSGTPGQEDCLKLLVWKPAKAKAGDKLPVHVYIHGGGLIFGDGGRDDFSDWVAQDQRFIAVNMNYRLGMLGFLNHPDLPSANAGLLDQRMALRWVKDNIAAFGGDPDEITLGGQSGGGWAVAAQIALYDGNTNNTFHRAIARSTQREPMFNTEELKLRNAALAQHVNCTAGQDQLVCFRNLTESELVTAFWSFSTVLGTEGIFKDQVFGYQGSFGPTIDDVTLTDSVTKLFRRGKLASVPVIAGSTTDEGFEGYINATQENPTPQNTTTLDPSTNRLTNLSDAQVIEVASFYPVNASYGSTVSGNFFLNTFHAYWMALALFGDAGIYGSERMVGRWMSAHHGPEKVWTFRFNAPSAGTNYSNPAIPLAPVTHSAENAYLNKPVASMTEMERALAVEFRTYLSSFICSGNPNTFKLDTAPTWPSYGALGDFVRSPVRLVPQLAYASNANKTYATGTEVEVAPKAGTDRTDFWQSGPILDSLRF